jgi:steroid delta-isomerase-like uncharacterized protein
MNRRMLIMGAALAATAGPASAQEDASRALADRFAATLSAHDMMAFAGLLADDYQNHQTSAAAPPGPPSGKTPKQATVAFFAARLAALPDLQVTTEAVVPTSGYVAASFVYTGTHLGPYFGIAPTGRTLRFTSCDIFAIRDGKLAEHWGMGDIAGILAQLRS